MHYALGLQEIKNMQNFFCDATDANINKIDKIDSNDRIDRIDCIGNFTHEGENTKGNTSARPLGTSSLSLEELLSGEALPDAQESKGVLSSRNFRSWEKEISEITYNRRSDVTYAKMSVFKNAAGDMQLALVYRNPELYQNRLQKVLFQLTSNRKDFLNNLNLIWGPGTRDKFNGRYREIALKMKQGVILYAGKGRPAQKQTKGKIARAPLYPESVAFVYGHDEHLVVVVDHHGFQCNWFFSIEEFNTTQNNLKMPIAVKEYRRSEQHGY